MADMYVETGLKVVIGALLAFLAERTVHRWRERERRRSIWDLIKGLPGVTFAISSEPTAANSPATRVCDTHIVQQIRQKCKWPFEPELPMSPSVHSLEDLNSHLFIIGSPRYNGYADLIQHEFETQMEFVWDLYLGDPASRLLKIVTRHGDEYVATADLKTDTNEESVDYGVFFHAVLETGKHVCWLAGIHGPGTVGVWKALVEQPELFAMAAKTRPGQARTWFFRIVFRDLPDKARREEPNNILRVDSLGSFDAIPRLASKSPPKVIVLDLGNVLMAFDRTRSYRRIGRHLQIDWHDVQKSIEGSFVTARYERGELSTEEFRKELCDLLEVDVNKLPPDLFADFWGDIFFANKKMIEAVHNLVTSNELVFVLLSNTNELHFENVSNHFPEVLEPFGERLVLSYKERCDKSGDKIFRRAVEVAGPDYGPRDCVFVDDKPENVSRANQLGMNGIVYFKYPHLVVRLRELGIHLK